ncbi:MAG TPA: hypothetical protein PK513_05565 [Alphaproteobacteria bacterium]|nr:MAG: hypothetical protein H6859_07305 [Rhodospirillales bacterium]HOO81950.1 hypothetical protein [Alphaproteobacteria bacterium]
MQQVFSVIARPDDEEAATLLENISELHMTNFDGEQAVYSGRGSPEQVNALQAAGNLTVICHE